MNSSISIIIPTRDRAAIFINSYMFLTNQISDLDYEIIVVNDSYKPFDEITSSELKKNPRVKIINTGGKGVAVARNAGVKCAVNNLLLFIDDDILVTKEQIIHIYDYQKKNPTCILMLNWEYTPELNSQLLSTKFGRYIINNQLNSFKGYRKKLSWAKNTIFEVEAFANFLIMIDKKLFLKVGGYNESFPFAGGEDTELSERLHKIGIRFFIDSTKTVFHNEIDRTELNGWLLRKEKSGMTIKAVEQLTNNHKSNLYSTKKLLLIKTALFFFPIIKFFAYLIPNKQIFNKTYASFINIMVACSIYKGYTYK